MPFKLKHHTVSRGQEHFISHFKEQRLKLLKRSKCCWVYLRQVGSALKPRDDAAKLKIAIATIIAS